MVKEVLTFRVDTARVKPNDMYGQSKCPFCDRPSLTNILNDSGDFMWLMNKYPTLSQTVQTIIIESQAHDTNLTTYSASYMERLWQYIEECWEKMASSGQYASTVLLKNHGPMSGSSLKHPHLQLIGLEKIDATAMRVASDFEGLELYSDDYCQATLSTQPIMGFVELNIISKRHHHSPIVSQVIQALVRYILISYQGNRFNSYNLHGWLFEDKQVIKIIPRWVDSAYYTGFGISQVYNSEELVKIRDEIRTVYLKNLS
ncbi:MAG: DUF4931 domain-containing protein [Bavariicoccus seileri]|uniref:DUF4931 domain-containing protein n=1 Tax=Bavariicoccus seileri TaxID=549685 RepID=UPI003F922DB9